MTRQKGPHRIYFSPRGKKLTQSKVEQLAKKPWLMLLCGHYEGIDQRVIDGWIDEEISIGDYVLSGGELPAAILVDTIGRLIPGVLNDETSALFDSFQDNLLAPPVYTRPEDFRGWKVPEILLSGNHRAINEWRLEQAKKKTAEIRPDQQRRAARFRTPCNSTSQWAAASARPRDGREPPTVVAKSPAAGPAQRTRAGVTVLMRSPGGMRSSTVLLLRIASSSRFSRRASASGERSTRSASR